MKDLKELEKKKAIELIDSYYNTTIHSDIYASYNLCYNLR